MLCKNKMFCLFIQWFICVLVIFKHKEIKALCSQGSFWTYLACTHISNARSRSHAGRHTYTYNKPLSGRQDKVTPLYIKYLVLCLFFFFWKLPSLLACHVNRICDALSGVSRMFILVMASFINAPSTETLAVHISAYPGHALFKGFSWAIL